ncbi:MAG TPA: hypothetical protein VIL01_03420 [Thermomicrobiales bacterium]
MVPRHIVAPSPFLVSILGVLAAVLTSFVGFAPAGAQDLERGYAIVSSNPLSDAGTIGQEVLCQCITPNDRITVIRTTGQEPISRDLSSETDFIDALWLLDIGNRGTYQLAIDFRRQEGQIVAEIYQDQNGDGTVAVTRSGGQFRVTEPGFWSIRVIARDGFWQRDGRLAPNFDISVDDRLMATFGDSVFRDRMANDGVADVVIRVRGPRPDDPRSFDWRNVYTPVPSSSGIYRTTLMVRERGLEPAFAPSFPWYLLGPPAGFVKPLGKSFPPIQVNPDDGRLTTIGEFVASRGSDQNWFTYSLLRVEPGSTIEPNFESPFAYYDLAQDQDGVPELQVRVERYIQDDPYHPSALWSRGSPLQAIRYSWDQWNTRNWTFKLALLGQHSIEDKVPFPEFTLQTIPYDIYPAWVTGRSWDIVTFVAAEEPLWTSEGIYAWDFSRGLRDSYYSGASESSGGFGESIQRGLRGDYSLHLASQPWLTFNPIDRQLHLARAEGGVWTIDERRQVRYFNDGGGEAYDGWQLWEDGQLAAQLYRVPGGLLYSDDDETLYLRAEIPHELFRVLPPTNHEEWQRLGEQLRAFQRDFAPGNLRAWFDQFGGTPVRVAFGPLTDFRRDADGVRFVVAVSDAHTQDLLANLTGARPNLGSQVVELADGRWRLEPASFALPQVTISAEQAAALRTGSVRVTIENPSNIDLVGATIEVQAIAADGDTRAGLADEDLDVEAGARQVLDLDWSPHAPGFWRVEAAIYRSGVDARTGERVILSRQERVVQVQPPPTIAGAEAARLGGTGDSTGRFVAIVGLVVVATTAAGIALRESRQTA